jgi:serine protease Do
MRTLRVAAALYLFLCLLTIPVVSYGKEAESLPSLSGLVEKLKPTVVNISTTKVVRSPMDDFFKDFRGFRDFFGDEFFRRFFGDMQPREYRSRSLGSGFIIDKDGHILTNNHVVEKADEITVKLGTGKSYEAEVIGRDPKTDLALIRIKADGELPVAGLGDSDELKVGEWVVAIGNPFGLEQTVTAGIISAKGRVIGAGPYDDFLQTDASINPGNSGGPLFNLTGEVVGINTAIVAGGTGIGFAIPINMAKRLLPQLKEGRVRYGYLGVYIQDLTPELAESFGLEEATGVLISEVLPGSAADKGGVQKGDVVVEYDGREVEDTRHFRQMVGNTGVGQTVTMVVLRDGKRTSLRVTIGELDEGAVVAAEPEERIETWGVKVQDITPELADQLGIGEERGVIITDVEPESPGAEAGLERGDVIVEVERQPVKNLAEYRNLLKQYAQKNALLLTVRVRAQRYHAMFLVLQKD